jgi:hypothetical protein
MNDFDYDVMVKKRVARGAFHRKRGSKSKKCTLPSDYLTASQWKRKNGDVIVFSMDSPILWADFLQLSTVTQKEYLTHLVDQFRASGATISAMMGVSYTKFVKHCKEIGFSLTGCRGHNMSKAQREDWEAFIAPLSAPSDTATAEPEEPEDTQICRDAVLVQPLSQNATAASPTNTLSSFSLCFNGRIDPDGIANSIRRLIMGDVVHGIVEIHCSFERRDADLS